MAELMRFFAGGKPMMLAHLRRKLRYFFGKLIRQRLLQGLKLSGMLGGILFL